MKLTWLILEIFSFLTWRNKFLFVVVLIFGVISIVVETFSLVSIYPFIELVSGNIDIYDRIIKLFQIMGMSYSLRVVFVLMFFLAVFGLSLRLLYAGVLSKMTRNFSNQLSADAYKNVINGDESILLGTNSNELISVIIQRIPAIVNSVFFSLLQIFHNVILLTFLCIALFMAWPKGTLVAILFFLIFYLFNFLFVRGGIDRDAAVISSFTNHAIRILQETLHGNRMIKFFPNRTSFFNQFQKVLSNLYDGQRRIFFRGAISKPILETCIIMFIVMGVYYASIKESLGEITVSSIALFVLTAIKMLPSFSLLFTSIISIQGSRENLKFVIKSLQVSNRYNGEDFLLKFMPLVDNIELINVGFYFNKKSDLLFKNLSFKITKGQVFGIFGPSGSGKSTLLDIILGLRKPKLGSILFDGKNYDQLFERLPNSQLLPEASYIPQKTILFNESILFNICLEHELKNIDYQKLNKVIEFSYSSFIHENGLNYIVGENGEFLSGGQRQRISIARALYQNRSIMVIDEGTGGLDSELELDVINSLKRNFSEMTIILVSHNNDIKKFCDNYISL